MTTIPPEYQPVVARFAERLAKLRPEACFRSDAEIEAEEATAINAIWGGQSAARADSDLSDEAAINLKIQQRN